MQVPLCWHGLDTHSLMEVSQLSPVKPAAQQHRYSPSPSVHEPPFRQGWLRHSLMFIAQVAPVKPTSHVHVNPLVWSLQVPLFSQGASVQQSMSIEQSSPVCIQNTQNYIRRTINKMQNYKLCKVTHNNKMNPTQQAPLNTNDHPSPPKKKLKKKKCSSRKQKEKLKDCMVAFSSKELITNLTGSRKLSNLNLFLIMRYWL